MGKVRGGTPPIYLEGAEISDYSNPVPHVLMLTAIVVGVATTALGLSIVIRIREAYGSIEEDELERLDRLAETPGSAASSGEAAE
jgi:multicomponent Na+:H+ antiporter subunit C